jgi:hypothetical protein
VARTVTRAVLRNNARLYADQRGRKFVEEDEANRLINLALAELYDRLVAAQGHEYYEAELAPPTAGAITTTSGTATYALPAGVYRILGFDLNWGADRLEPVPALASIADRARFNGVGWGEFTPKAFRLRGAQPSGTPATIELFPTPTSAVATVLRYVPAFADLTSESATFDGVNGWDRAVALRVALEMRAIAGLESTTIQGLYDRELQRIDELAADRAAAHAPTIRDVNPEGNLFDDWYRHLPPAG